MKKITLLISALFIILISSITNSQWNQLNGPGKPYVYSIFISGSKMFAGTMQDGLYTSTNNGMNWTQFEVSWHNQVSDVTGNSSTVFFSTMNANPELLNGVFRSTDNGQTWTQTLYNSLIKTISLNGTIVYAGEYNNGIIHKSTDNGITWKRRIIYGCESVFSIYIDNSFILAGALHGLYKSTDAGLSWFKTSMPNESIWRLTKCGNHIFAGTIWGSGIYRSDDNGETWILTAMHNRDIDGLVSYGNNLIAAALTDDEALTGIYVSTDFGSSWTKRNEGYYSNYTMISLYIHSNIIYGGLDNIWTRRLSDIIGIQSLSSNIPQKYHLSQNYPNPFNPSTTIKFDIPKYGYVKMEVMNILGEVVSALVNSNIAAGSYSVTWDASNFSSGIYFCRINAGSFIDIRKMVLIK